MGLGVLGHQLDPSISPTAKLHRPSQPCPLVLLVALPLPCSLLLQMRRPRLAATRGLPVSTWTAGWWAGTMQRHWRRRSSASPAGQSSWCRWAGGDCLAAALLPFRTAAWLLISASYAAPAYACMPAFIPTFARTHNRAAGAAGPLAGPLPLIAALACPACWVPHPNPSPD